MPNTNILLPTLITLIKKNTTIPVIGFDLYKLKKQQIGEDGTVTIETLSLLEFLAFEYLRKHITSDRLMRFNNKVDEETKITFENLKITFENYSLLIIVKKDDIPIEGIKQFFKMLYPSARTGIEIMHSLFHSLKPLDPEIRQAFREEISLLIKQYDKNGVLPLFYDAIVQLSVIKNFKFYVNATFLNTLMSTLTRCRTGNADLIASHGYYPGGTVQSTEFKVNAKRLGSNEETFNQAINDPTVFNLFGDHVQDPITYVITEADFIELIMDLIGNDKKYKKFKDLLSEANLLFLGCNFKDWFLRFFLRLCYVNRSDFDNIDKKPKYMIDDLGYDTNSVVFMNNYAIKFYEGSTEQFIFELYSGLLQRDLDEGSHSIEKKFFYSEIFLSFNSEDRDEVRLIYNQLKKRFDVYMDEVELQGGDKLDKHFAEKINKNVLFIPIITSKIANIENKDRFFWKEWGYAAANSNTITILPIWIGTINNEIILPPGIAYETEIKQEIIRKTRLGVIMDIEHPSLSDKQIVEIADILYKIRANYFVSKKQIYGQE